MYGKGAYERGRRYSVQQVRIVHKSSFEIQPCILLQGCVWACTLTLLLARQDRNDPLMPGGSNA
eukprot:COSAG02_NODE_193_length_29843_cov_30.519903_12_plen_64_part_00